MILRVFVSDIIVKKDKYGPPDYYWVVGRLPSGIEVIIEDIYYDLHRCIGNHVEMLLSFMRSPYCELQRGIHNQIFLPEKFYSVELIDELLKKEGVISTGNRRIVILTGEYIDSYTIPVKWVSLTQQESFKAFFKKPSALRTEDGTYLLYPWHSQRRVSIEEIPQEVKMAGVLRLEAWTPSE